MGFVSAQSELVLRGIKLFTDQQHPPTFIKPPECSGHKSWSPWEDQEPLPEMRTKAKERILRSPRYLGRGREPLCTERVREAHPGDVMTAQMGLTSHRRVVGSKAREVRRAERPRGLDSILQPNRCSLTPGLRHPPNVPQLGSTQNSLACLWP